MSALVQMDLQKRQIRTRKAVVFQVEINMKNGKYNLPIMNAITIGRKKQSFYPEHPGNQSGRDTVCQESTSYSSEDEVILPELGCPGNFPLELFKVKLSIFSQTPCL